MILLFPYGGLCNRLRAYDAGLTLSRISKKPLFVFWEKNAELNCSFSSLYLQPTGSSYTFNISPNTRAVLEKAFSPFCTKITQETIREIGVGANKYSQLAKKIFSSSHFRDFIIQIVVSIIIFYHFNQLMVFKIRSIVLQENLIQKLLEYILEGLITNKQ